MAEMTGNVAVYHDLSLSVPWALSLTLSSSVPFLKKYSQNDMAEMTGNVAVGKRGDAWTSKRVFFLTPQVVENL